jgi:hypothetical protein
MLKEDERATVSSPERRISRKVRAVSLIVAFGLGVGGVSAYRALHEPAQGSGAGPYERSGIFDKSKPLAWNSDFGTQTTLQAAQERASYSLYRPKDLEGSTPEVWISADSKETAFRYDSNLIVYVVPWRISRTPEETYQAEAEELGGSAATLSGNPAVVVPVDALGPGNPAYSSVIVAIDGDVEITLSGTRPLDELVKLAESLQPAPTEGTSANGGFGAAGNSGANWSPNVPPVSHAQETTLDQAVSQAGYPFFRATVALASDDSVSHVWLGTQEAGEGMLPKQDQREVAISYSSGVVVSYIPWQYGPSAPPFSEGQVARHDKAAEAHSPRGLMTASSIRGVPALILATNFEGQDNPGSIELHLGTSNEDAVEVVVYGRYPSVDLMNVAASIVEQWEHANE